VEFKEKSTPRIADCVAAMANLYGGLIFVGITDTEHDVVGVKRETLTHLADQLTQRLDPADYLPEMFEVDIPGQPGNCIVVIRVRAENAPRPVLVQRTIGSGNDKTSVFWLPIRTPGGTRQASRAEMAALFSEQQKDVLQQSSWQLNAPSFPTGQDGTPDSSVDLMIRTGLLIPAGPSPGGRPLSERAIATLCRALDMSELATLLPSLAVLDHPISKFDRRGIPNASSNATLTWQAKGYHPAGPPLVGVTVRIQGPNQYGRSHIQTLEVIVDIMISVSAARNGERPPPSPPENGRYRLEIITGFCCWTRS
jgi:hypothetical protein